MDIIKILVIILCILLLILLFLYTLRYALYNYYKQLETYREVINVKNVSDLRKHFVLDNPNEDGTDPTGGMVDYSFMFERDNKGKIKPNFNGDISWQDIPKNPSLLKDYENGFYIGLDKDIKDGKVGAPRLISRKLYRGGLFIFDVEHCPIGCGVWPALWLNGFVGGKDQYHAQKGTSLYKKGMKKLVKSTINNNTKENFDRLCKDKNSSLNSKKDPHLSEYLGKDTYVAMWPTGGEIDILEQTNFSKTNLISIHGGPLCEVVNGYDNNYNKKDEELGQDYIDAGVRSVCGKTYDGFGPYSGCKDNEHKIGEEGGDSTRLPNGRWRYNCPAVSTDDSGNSQVVAPFGSFGEIFNFNGGGVYALQWTPKDSINVWWFPKELYSRELMKYNGMPLSENPDPKYWPREMFPDQNNVSGSYKKQKVLVASYILNNKNALTSGCDFNYQGITINITLGGGWGSAAMPSYCSAGDKKGEDFIKACYKADPQKALKNKNGVDPDNGCYDGGMSNKGENRGSHAPPVFYKEAYFKIRQIRVLQKYGDDNIW